MSEDPEEEKKQKEIKGLLNKITPEKYETIREKLMASGIDNAKTLRGLIDQARAPALLGAGGGAARRALCAERAWRVRSVRRARGDRAGV